MKKRFKCTGDNFEILSKEYIDKYEIRYPEAHTKIDSIITLAKAFKESRKDYFVRIPFCVTVEAEALGADIKLGDEKNGPRVNEYVINNLADLKAFNKIDLTNGRIKSILESVKKMSKTENVALTSVGPFTIISSLIDPSLFYRWIRKSPELIDNFIRKIEDSIIDYILAGIDNGAKIISFSDPVGSIDIVGPRVYKKISGKVSYNILRRIEPFLNNTVVHLCGKTSSALEEIELSSTKTLTGFNIPYGEAIISNLGKIKYMGNKCIKLSPFKVHDGNVYIIHLK